MERPVRGSPTLGGCGASSPGEKPLKAPSRCPIDLAFCTSTRRCANFCLKTIGASEVVSEPMAMPHSISPVAILACEHRRRLQAGAARLLDGDAGRGGGELGAEHRLAREVPVLGVRHDGAADRLVDVRAREAVLVDEPVEHASQHLQVGFVGIERVGAAERDAHAADHRHAPKSIRHRGLQSFMLALRLSPPGRGREALTYGRAQFGRDKCHLESAAVSHAAELVRGDCSCLR